MPYKKGWYGSTVIGARKEESGGYEFEIEYDPIVHDGVEHKGGTEVLHLHFELFKLQRNHSMQFQAAA